MQLVEDGKRNHVVAVVSRNRQRSIDHGPGFVRRDTVDTDD